MFNEKVINLSELKNNGYVVVSVSTLWNMVNRKRNRYLSDTVNHIMIKNTSFIRSIPITTENAYFEDDHLSVSRNLKLLEFNKIRFVYDKYNNSLICHINDVKKLMYDIAILLKSHSIKHVRTVETPKTAFDYVVEKLNKQYLNRETINEFNEAIRPYVATFWKRRDLEINMNLSIILSGMPGDGKTYFSVIAGNILHSRLSLPFVMEEAITFERAAKLADSFVALIDDMNIAHFQRNGPYANVCSNILSELDKPKTNRLFLLTTNERVSRETIDSAFFRPGRVQSIISVTHPDSDTKTRFCKDFFSFLRTKELTVDNNFATGITMLTCDNELSLAELFRMKNLIISDIIIEEKLNTPQSYISKCKAVSVEMSVEPEYC